MPGSGDSTVFYIKKIRFPVRIDGPAMRRLYREAAFQERFISGKIPCLSFVQNRQVEYVLSGILIRNPVNADTDALKIQRKHQKNGQDPHRRTHSMDFRGKFPEKEQPVFPVFPGASVQAEYQKGRNALKEAGQKQNQTEDSGQHIIFLSKRLRRKKKHTGQAGGQGQRREKNTEGLTGSRRLFVLSVQIKKLPHARPFDPRPIPPGGEQEDQKKGQKSQTACLPGKRKPQRIFHGKHVGNNRFQKPGKQKPHRKSGGEGRRSDQDVFPEHKPAD